MLAQRRNEQLRIVGDPRRLRRHRREVRDLHESSLAIARSQVTSTASDLPGLAEDAGFLFVRGEPRGCVADLGRRRSDDEPRASVVDDVERTSCVAGRDDGLRRQEGLVRPHPVVLVHGRVVERRARRVQLGESLGVDAPLETHPTVEPAVARNPLESTSIGPVRDDHDVEARPERGGLEQQVDALGPIEAARRQDEAERGGSPIGQRLRRGRQHLGHEAGRTLEPPSDVPGDRKQACGLSQRRPVERLHLSPQRTILGRGAELAQVGPVELVRLPELVHEPDAFLGMPHDVGGELRRHHHVDLLPVDLAQIDEPPEERLRQHSRARVPLERHGDEVRFVPSVPELRDELVGDDLGAATRERDLRPKNRDAHGPPSASPLRGAAPPRLRAQRHAARGRRRAGAPPR